MSLDAQRRELIALAKAKSLPVVEEFADAVESGKDDQRPGFQSLLRRLKDPERTWSYLLALDTSRIARNQYLAHALHYEAEKRGIKVLYAKIPETNTLVDVVIRAVMQAFDQLHSLMSREKGLTGMAENVRQGWRAGGRAPRGYELRHMPTGATRDGFPVTKSKLALGAEARHVAAYLKSRASDVRRDAAAVQAGLHATASSLIGIEWNALTYAGHTVWNVHAERLPGGEYKGGQKRRPREEWVIQYDTHPALITTDEAEKILGQLNRGRAKKYKTRAQYLLSGLLVTPNGRAWHGNGDGYYRAEKGPRIAQQSIEEAIVRQVTEDLQSKTFIAALVEETRRMATPQSINDLRPLREKLSAITAKIGRLADLAADSETARPFLEQIREQEKHRAALVEELDKRESEIRAVDVLRTITEPDVRRILNSLTENMQHADRDALKAFLTGLLERVELDPETQFCRLHYAVRTGDFVASPRGFEPFPAFTTCARVGIPHNRRRTVPQ